MKLFVILLSLMLTSCKCKSDKPKESVQPSLSLEQVREDKQDSIILNYIKQSENDLIVYAREDTIPVSWMKEKEIRDGTKYTMVRIGQSLEYRFTTLGWIFIDSLGQVYEYELAEDSLVKWNK